MTSIKESLRTIAEQELGVSLSFLNYGSNWVYEADSVIVKASNNNLDYAMNIAKYLASHGYAALVPSQHFRKNECFFYVYPKGNAGFGRAQVADWLGEVLGKLHRLPLPPKKLFKTYEDITQYKLHIYNDGFLSLPIEIQNKVIQKLEKAFQLPNECMNHGDPNEDNVVQINGTKKLIDWDIAYIGPHEGDLATIKYAQRFGEPESTFNNLCEKFGSYNQESLVIMTEAITAISLVWFAQNCMHGYFQKAEKELQKRTDYFMGKNTDFFDLNSYMNAG